MSIDEALDAYLLQLEADGRSPHTIGQARRHVRLFAAWAATAGVSRVVARVRAQNVASFLVSPQARTRPDGGLKKASSVNALRSSLRAFFGYATAAGFTPSDPTRLVRRARTGPAIPRTASAEAVAAVLAAVRADGSWAACRDHALFATMVGLGIRVGAVVALDAADVDLRAGTLTIRTKGDIVQSLPIPRSPGDALSLGDTLRDWIVVRGGDGQAAALFPSVRGTRLTTRHVSRRLRHWCAVADVEPISPHQLRHTFATRLYERTGDLRLVQEALGHRSIASTIVYARVSPARLRAALCS